MERTAVTSSNIVSMGFERTKVVIDNHSASGFSDQGIVDVEFLNGSIYRHHDVPFTLFEGVRQALSIGTAYGLVLKGKFNVEKIKAAEARAAKTVTEMLAKNWQVTRNCCTSGMCVECHRAGRVGHPGRIVHADKLTKKHAQEMARNWKSYDGKAEEMEAAF